MDFILQIHQVVMILTEVAAVVTMMEAVEAAWIWVNIIINIIIQVVIVEI